MQPLKIQVVKANVAQLSELKPRLKINGLNFYYGGFHALKNVTMDIPER